MCMHMCSEPAYCMPLLVFGRRFEYQSQRATFVFAHLYLKSCLNWLLYFRPSIACFGILHSHTGAATVSCHTRGEYDTSDPCGSAVTVRTRRCMDTRLGPAYSSTLRCAPQGFQQAPTRPLCSQLCNACASRATASCGPKREKSFLFAVRNLDTYCQSPRK